MHEVESGHQEKIIPQFKTLEEAFSYFLNIDFPNDPSELPTDLLLPEAAFGGFIEAVVAQDLDDLQMRMPSRERSQFVGFLERNGGLKNSKVFIGTTAKVKEVRAEVSRWFRPLLGKVAKPLTYWHTHVKEKRHYPTNDDVVYRVAEDRKGLIYLLGAPDGIVAIIQTKQAIPSKLPLSTMRKGFQAYDELLKVYDSDHDSPSMAALAQFLEESGYVLYKWKKQSSQDTVRQAYERGEFMDGIKLERVEYFSPRVMKVIKEKFVGEAK